MPTGLIVSFVGSPERIAITIAAHKPDEVLRFGIDSPDVMEGAARVKQRNVGLFRI